MGGKSVVTVVTVNSIIYPIGQIVKPYIRRLWGVRSCRKGGGCPNHLMYKVLQALARTRVVPKKNSYGFGIQAGPRPSPARPLHYLSASVELNGVHLFLHGLGHSAL